MAEERTLWDMLTDWAGPREAEAEIRPAGADEARTLAELQRANQMELQRTPSAYLPRMYAQVYRAAQAHPETVIVRRVQDLLNPSPADPSARPAAAIYAPGSNEIRYDAGVGQRDLANVLPHELLHFLGHYSPSPMSAGAQHALIRLLLGTSTYTPGMGSRRYGDREGLVGYQPPAISPQDQERFRDWFVGRATPYVP